MFEKLPDKELPGILADSLNQITNAKKDVAGLEDMTQEKGGTIDLNAALIATLRALTIAERTHSECEAEINRRHVSDNAIQS
jgi:hypothetical protein